MYEIGVKTFVEGIFMCAPSFLVCARLTTCAHAHNLEGTLVQAAFCSYVELSYLKVS